MSDSAAPTTMTPAAEAARAVLTPVSFDALPGWSTDRVDWALGSFRRSCSAILKKPSTRQMGPDPQFGRIGDWQPACRSLAGVSGETAARRYFETTFAAYRIDDPQRPEGLITGYFEPQLNGAWAKSDRYRYPLYGLPKDLISVDLGRFDAAMKGRQIAGRVAGNRLVPYDARREIERGSLAGKRLELLWLDSAVDAFFLHIQGSGRVRMTTGETVRVGFAGRNGQVYTAIGRELVRRGAIPADQVSLQSIRAWLLANPDKAQSVMDINRSYIFFRKLTGDGPIGAQGVALSPGRSLAVDRGVLPLGAPIWLTTRNPLNRSEALNRLVIAQDTGSAIRGVVRGDLFWGAGDRARAAAGEMQEPGGFHILLPRGLPPPGS